MAPGRERQLNALAELQKYSPGVSLGHHPWTLQPTTLSSYIRSTLSPNHRPFITMACSSTPQPGSTVPKPYRNGKHDILWRMCTQLSSVEFPPVSRSTMSSP